MNKGEKNQMIKGIEHVAIYAKDTKGLADWYVKLFGASIVYDNGKGTYFVAFPDKSMIEICKNDTVDNVPTDMNTPGIRHFALTTDEFDADVAKIKAEGVEILAEPIVSPKGIGTMFFRDIEGNIFHLISRPEPLV